MNYGGYGSERHVPHLIQCNCSRWQPLGSPGCICPTGSPAHISDIYLTAEERKAPQEAQLHMHRMMQEALSKPLFKDYEPRPPETMTAEPQVMQAEDFRVDTATARRIVLHGILAWMRSKGYSVLAGDAANPSKLLSSIAEQAADRARAEMHKLAEAKQDKPIPRESIADEWMRRR